MRLRLSACVWCAVAVIAAMLAGCGSGSAGESSSAPGPTASTEPSGPVVIDEVMLSVGRAGSAFAGGVVFAEDEIAFLQPVPGDSDAPSTIAFARPGAAPRVVVTGSSRLPSIHSLAGGEGGIAWVQTARTGDGVSAADLPWEIHALVDGADIIVARSTTDGAASIALEWPWLAWTEQTLAADPTAISLTNLVTGAQRELSSQPLWLVAIDRGRVWWIEGAGRLVSQSLDGADDPTLFLEEPDLREVAVNEGTAMWMVRPDDIHPDTGTLFASQTAELKPVQLAEKDDSNCEVEMGIDDGFGTPCSTGAWGYPVPAKGFVAWRDHTDGLVAATLTDPGIRLRLEEEYDLTYPPDVLGDRIVGVAGVVDADTIVELRVLGDAADADDIGCEPQDTQDLNVTSVDDTGTTHETKEAVPICLPVAHRDPVWTAVYEQCDGSDLASLRLVNERGVEVAVEPACAWDETGSPPSPDGAYLTAWQHGDGAAATLHLIALGAEPRDLGAVPYSTSANYSLAWTADGRVWFTYDRSWRGDEDLWWHRPGDPISHGTHIDHAAFVTRVELAT